MADDRVVVSRVKLDSLRRLAEGRRLICLEMRDVFLEKRSASGASQDKASAYYWSGAATAMGDAAEMASKFLAAVQALTDDEDQEKEGAPKTPSQKTINLIIPLS